MSVRVMSSAITPEMSFSSLDEAWRVFNHSLTNLPSGTRQWMRIAFYSGASSAINMAGRSTIGEEIPIQLDNILVSCSRELNIFTSALEAIADATVTGEETLN